MSQSMSEETEKAVRLIGKLLKLAGNNPSAEQAAAATAKAQELLTLHNLDMSAVERNGGDSGRREDQLLRGGVYEWQRDLWHSVADLNFCLYWNEEKFLIRTTTTKGPDGTTTSIRERVKARRHRLVGRAINVTVSRQMAEYVEGAIERKVRERCGADGKRSNSLWATSYRKGAAQQVMEKVYERRRAMLDKEQREGAEAEQRKQAAAMAGVSTATALTISDVQKSERDANIDFVYGEGTSARWAADRAKRAQAAKEAEEQMTAWAAANPEEAAKRAAAERKEQEKRERRWSRKSWFDTSEKIDYGAYKSGYEAAKDIGLEPQVRDRNAGRLTHG